MLKLSKHAAERLVERGIDEADVYACVSSGRCLGHVGGVGVYALGCLRVVLDSADGTIITVWKEPPRNPKREIRKTRKRHARNLREWRRGCR